MLCAAAAVLAAAGFAALLTVPIHAHRIVTVGGYTLKGGSTRPATVAHAELAWCGTDTAATDRAPDLAAGNQIHVIYAFPSDGEDRFAALAGGIATDVGAIVDWWRRQDPSRAPRFDLYAFPGCAPGAGQLDLSRVQLSQPGSYYLDSPSRMVRVALELGQTFADPAKKYLVYYDGPIDDARLCGQSVLSPGQGGRFSYSVIYTQACRADIGAGSLTASVAAHELAHNLGAVPAAGPPHPCPDGDTAHVCDDENDLMYPYTHGQGLNALALDVGRDDYYGHSGGWWDLQDSPWLLHGQQFPLTVSFVDSTGAGTVTSLTPGLSCPPDCSTAWDEGTQVQLLATPAAGSRFVRWAGACSADPCIVTMSQAQTVFAEFAAEVNLSVAVKRISRGSGTVTSRPAGIACPPACATTLDKGTTVALTARPAKGSAFAGWAGACAGKAECTVSLESSARVVAIFGPPPTLRPPARKTVPKCKRGQRPTKKKPCRR